jgi:membrane-associated phospholipid phosphatase
MTGNTGNTGNTGKTGNTGNVGNVGGGGGLFYPDRVDLPFTFAVLQGQNPPLDSDVTALRKFPMPLWDQQWLSWLVLQDFATTTWQTCPFSTPGAQIPTKLADIEAELGNLEKAAIDERPDALGEILGQADEFLTYFIQVLGINTTAFPNTRQLLHIGNLVGSFAVMYYKASINRARPSQYMPALLPPIAVPGHASYPSGHSTQAHLVAACVALALPAPSAGVASPTTVALAGVPGDPTKPGALNVLADRIARNREIAGLHFPSDSAAGVELATYCLTLLKGLNSFKTVVTAAQKEWQ